MYLSIIIPLYNEERNIEKIFLKIHKNLFSNLNYEIIFVDDESTDDSSKILKKLSKKNKNVFHLHRIGKKRDLTQSCFDGISKSKYKNILIMDCDLQHDPKNILSMIKTFQKEKADFVVGVRNFDKKHSGLPYHRSIVSRLLILIINIFLGKKVNDPMSGFFLFKKKHFVKAKKNLFGRGYKIFFDLIYCIKYKIKIVEQEITLFKRNSGESKMSFTTLRLIIYQIIRLFINRIINFK
tara:strand:+ start:1488 stop:2201 length:714 start_codon:yes stop_codon:yes gene_type:complete